MPLAISQNSSKYLFCPNISLKAEDKDKEKHKILTAENLELS